VEPHRFPEGQLRRIPRCYDLRELCELERQRQCCHDLHEHKHPRPCPQQKSPNQTLSSHGKGRFRMLAAATGCMAVAATVGSGKNHFRHDSAEGPLGMVEPSEHINATVEHQDPWGTERQEPCCHGLKQQLGQRDGSGRHHFMCVDKMPVGPICEEQWDTIACIPASEKKNKGKNKNRGTGKALHLAGDAVVLRAIA